jgi:hypothetical protein
MQRSMLTTVDNPYDPFDDYARWFHFDLSHGYNSASFLARLAYNTTDLSEAISSAEIERTIDHIVAINPSGMYRKVTKEVE